MTCTHFIKMYTLTRTHLLTHILVTRIKVQLSMQHIIEKNPKSLLAHTQKRTKQKAIGSNNSTEKKMTNKNYEWFQHTHKKGQKFCYSPSSHSVFCFPILLHKWNACIALLWIGRSINKGLYFVDLSHFHTWNTSPPPATTLMP